MCLNRFMQSDMSEIPIVTSHEGLYFTIESSYKIHLVEEHRCFLTFLFAQAGINIHHVTTPNTFTDVFKKS